MIEIPVYFDELSAKKQKEIKLLIAPATEKDYNWDTFSITTIILDLTAGERDET